MWSKIEILLTNGEVITHHDMHVTCDQMHVSLWTGERGSPERECVDMVRVKCVEAMTVNGMDVEFSHN